MGELDIGRQKVREAAARIHARINAQSAGHIVNADRNSDMDSNNMFPPPRSGERTSPTSDGTDMNSHIVVKVPTEIAAEWVLRGVATPVEQVTTKVLPLSDHDKTNNPVTIASQMARDYIVRAIGARNNNADGGERLQKLVAMSLDLDEVARTSPVASVPKVVKKSGAQRAQTHDCAEDKQKDVKISPTIAKKSVVKLKTQNQDDSKEERNSPAFKNVFDPNTPALKPVKFVDFWSSFSVANTKAQPLASFWAKYENVRDDDETLLNTSHSPLNFPTKSASVERSAINVDETDAVHPTTLTVGSEYEHTGVELEPQLVESLSHNEKRELFTDQMLRKVRDPTGSKQENNAQTEKCNGCAWGCDSCWLRTPADKTPPESTNLEFAFQNALYILGVATGTYSLDSLLGRVAVMTDLEPDRSGVFINAYELIVDEHERCQMLDTSQSTGNTMNIIDDEGIEQDINDGTAWNINNNESFYGKSNPSIKGTLPRLRHRTNTPLSASSDVPPPGSAGPWDKRWPVRHMEDIDDAFSCDHGEAVNGWGGGDATQTNDDICRGCLSGSACINSNAGGWPCTVAPALMCTNDKSCFSSWGQVQWIDDEVLSVAASDDFLKEQDDAIMRKKNEGTKESWAVLAAALPDEPKATEDRFKNIEPEDWKSARQGRSNKDAPVPEKSVIEDPWYCYWNTGRDTIDEDRGCGDYGWCAPSAQEYPNSCPVTTDQAVAKDLAITYWITIESDNDTVHIPIDDSNVSGREKAVVTLGMKKVWKWMQDKKLTGKANLRDAYALANEMHQENEVAPMKEEAPQNETKMTSSKNEEDTFDQEAPGWN